VHTLQGRKVVRAQLSYTEHYSQYLRVRYQSRGSTSLADDYRLFAVKQQDSEQVVYSVIVAIGHELAA